MTGEAFEKKANQLGGTMLYMIRFLTSERSFMVQLTIVQKLINMVGHVIIINYDHKFVYYLKTLGGFEACSINTHPFSPFSCV